MKSDEQIVRTVNSCLNLLALSRLLTTGEWNRFIDLVGDPGDPETPGQLRFSGDPTGFHIDSDGSNIDCASMQTSLCIEFWPKKEQALLTKRGAL